MKPAPNKHPEVVYRRLPVPGSSENNAEAEPENRGLALALTPLIIGFVLLLGLISAVAFISVRLMNDVGFRAREVGLQRTGRLNLLWDVRLKVTRLDSEARARARTESEARELAPPFDFRLNTNRAEVIEVARQLDTPPLSREASWQKLHNDLQAYIEITKDPKVYSLKGFEKFRVVDADLNDLFLQVQSENDEVIKGVIDLQVSFKRSIITWSVVALLVGALVAFGTIWEVQRHFRQMRRSMFETRRERTFTTQLLQGMVSAVAAIDNEDRIRSANPAFFRIFPNASIGASVLEKLGPDDAMKMLETVTSIRVRKATYHGRLIARVEEEDKAFDVYSAPLSINGEPGQAVTLVDATEAAESERTLRRSESLAAVGQATTQVAHEIRNPLGSIRLGVSMLRDSVSDPEALNTIELVERGIKHLNKLVVDVTQFSRQKELERAAVDLHESLERSIDLVSERIVEKNTTVEKQFSARSIVGQWDPYQLRQVFVNVIANAVDASQENSEVLISTELLAPETNGDGQSPRHYARITIADSGRGMDKATRDRIFEPFFSTKKRGTGLGLAIVKQIVELHGGRISVNSEIGKGSQFRIDLPV
ncbi:MAG TPA: ATP-binding protein [Pyrinomonadaceae bacterium]|nr:ATP-binding protein [Pyrinomonadaceae bacterium]